MFIKMYTDNELNFFPLYVSTAELNHLQEKCTRNTGFLHHHLFIVRKGQGMYTLLKGDMFYIEAKTPHEYYGITKDFTTDYMTFFGDNFKKIKEYYSLGDYGIYKNKNSNIFEGHLTKILDNAKGVHELSTLSSLTYSAVIAFFDEVCKKQPSPIEEVYSFIESNYSKTITLDDLLSFYPYSKSKLCSEFKAEYKMTIFEMLTQIRLKNAHYLLKSSPHLKLADIAIKCGFNDSSYFCKMYKRYYESSPKHS